MKITLISTHDSGGGASIACSRLMSALKENSSIEVNMIVQHKRTLDTHVHRFDEHWTGEIKATVNFLEERLPFILFEAKEKSMNFAFSTARAGSSIANDPLVIGSDVLHLHWINGGFLSVKNLRSLFALRKPIVWTLHDMWPFTGGCHYVGECDHFKIKCGNCQFLRRPGKNDLSRSGWTAKRQMFAADQNLTFVSCSRWLQEKARASSLIGAYPIETIPNPIDTELFKPIGKLKSRKKWGVSDTSKVILFGAANINDRRKGMDYLLEAINLLNQPFKDDNILLVIFGKNKSFDISKINLPIKNLGVIADERALIEIYNMADVFVNPSIEDNLPNTVMEALSCGTPVVAFNTGGMPEMIEHLNNGYLAKFKSATDLALGIERILSADGSEEFSANARKKAINEFNLKKIGTRYVEWYRHIMDRNPLARDHR